MKSFLSVCSIGTRHLHKTAYCNRFLSTQTARPTSLPQASFGLDDVQSFRDQALGPQRPLVFSQAALSSTSSLPAASKWFKRIGENGSPGVVTSSALSTYMDQFQEWPFPYELVTPSVANNEALVAFRDWLTASEEPVDQILAGVLEPSITELADRSFFQLYAPLRLLAKALEFNGAQPSQQSEPVNLYIAQSSLSDLPPALQGDLPTPEIIQHAGKGDVYSSSIWLGTEPTYTPLHRDPNPNLFYQLCSSKVIRLVAPKLGDRLFFEVQARIRQHGNSRIRTAEMMEGAERAALHDAVWEANLLPEGAYEAELAPGDSMFIPNGWWHSVKSKGDEGQLNASVNWWFR